VQVGLEAFRQTPGKANPPQALARKSPDQIVAARWKDDSQGVMGRFRGADQARYSVTFDEGREDGRFIAINSQHLTTASANDRRSYTDGYRPMPRGPDPCAVSNGVVWDLLDWHSGRRRKALRRGGTGSAPDEGFRVHQFHGIQTNYPVGVHVDPLGTRRR
jgi:hypothetical protein